MGNVTLFEETCSKFIDALPIEERNRFVPCNSPEEFLDAVRKLDVLAKKGQKSRAAAVISKITCLSDKLRPFFEVIGIFVQTNPEYAGFFWGSLRFVLELASRFTTFFDKLIENIESITEVFPSLEGVASLCRQMNSTRLRSLLEKVYVDLFDFFHSVSRVFISKSNGIKKTAVVVREIFWTPFEARFQALLCRMSRHQELVRHEILLLGAQAAANILQIAAEQRKLADLERKVAAEEARKSENANLGGKEKKATKTFQEILQWLSPPPFTEMLAECHEVREAGTNQWLFSDETFMRWRKSTNKGSTDLKHLGPNALWIKGNPGCGKTILASSAIEELEFDSRVSGHSYNVFYFFFKNDHFTESTTEAAYRSILAQLIAQKRHDQDFLDKFSFILNKTTDKGCPRATYHVLADLLKSSLLDVNCYIVLDGIDECSDHMILIRDLLWISSHCTAKILLFGRRNIPGLNRRAPKECQLLVDHYSMSEDIRIFLTAKVESLKDDDLLPFHSSTCETVERLVRGADGMFLWAKLMLVYLSSPALTPGRRMKTIEDVILPEGLDKMYQRLLQLIVQFSPTERHLASWIITWVLHSVNPLTSTQLQEALNFTDDDSGKDPNDRHHDFEETVSFVCAGLVECSHDKGTGGVSVVRFMHLSVKEHFVLASQRSEDQSILRGIVLPDFVANMCLTTACLRQVISQASQGTTFPANMIPSLASGRCFPNYSAVNWMKHLNHAIYPPDGIRPQLIQEHEGTILETVLKLLELLSNAQNTSTWLTMYYASLRSETEKDPNFDSLNIHTGLHDWASSVQGSSKLARALRRLNPELQGFIQDMKQIVAHWGDRLCSNPLLVWKEVAAFSRSKYLVQSSSTGVTFMAPTRPRKSLSRKYLCRISTTTPDTQMTAVLSIWTSESFEKEWQNHKLDYSRSSHLQLCEGWYALYQLWDMDGLNLMAEYKTSLDKDEVSLQMRQSFRQEDTNSWTTSFPMAISRDCQSFIVLRTLFVSETANGPSNTSFKSANIPLDLTERLQSYWSDQLKPFIPEHDDIQNLTSQWKHDWYTYSNTFSPTGEYILFSDRNRSVVTNACGVHVGVFAVEKRGDDLSVRLVAMRRLNALLALTIDQVLFHPQLKLVIVRFGGNVVIWRFEDVHADFKFLRREQLDDLMWTSAESGNETIISACGRYVIVTSQKLNGPICVPIPQNALASTSHFQLTSFEETSAQGSEQMVTRNNPSGAISDIRWMGGQALRRSEAHCQPDGQISHTVSAKAQKTVSITVTEILDNCPRVHNLDLVTLPQWQGIENAEPLIKFSPRNDSPLRIILNAPQEKGYSMLATSNAEFPLVIDTDLTGVRHTFPANVSQQETIRWNANNLTTATSLEQYKKSLGIPRFSSRLSYSGAERSELDANTKS